CRSRTGGRCRRRRFRRGGARTPTGPRPRPRTSTGPAATVPPASGATRRTWSAPRPEPPAVRRGHASGGRARPCRGVAAARGGGPAVDDARAMARDAAVPRDDGVGRAGRGCAVGSPRGPGRGGAGAVGGALWPTGAARAGDRGGGGGPRRGAADRGPGQAAGG